MSEPQIDDPIKDPHIEFGKAVVRLAREHGVGELSMDFDLSSSKRFFEKNADYQKVKLTWKEERHGSRGRLHFHATATASIKEDAE